MIEFFKGHPRAGVVAPRIVFPDNRLHPSARCFITLFGAVLDVFQVHLYFANNIVARHFTYNNWKHDAMREVDWVTGAAFMTKRETFKTCGMLDERFFMYFEDMDYCMTVNRNGYATYFCPRFSVVHHHAKGGSDKLPVRSVDYYISLHRYLFKHKSPFAAGFFRLTMVSWGLLYLVIRTAKHFVSGDEGSLRERIDTPLRLIGYKSYEA
jgi:GT2 family glycosyltransferase